MSTPTEVWLRGPVAGIPALLQPAAHVLVQAREEVDAIAPTVPIGALWAHRGGATSGFHLLHLAGALDRLFTYARGEALTDEQKAVAKAEGVDHPELDGARLAAIVRAAIDKALDQLRRTDETTLTTERRIGRAGLPATVGGALFHGAEHTSRHVGQFITSVKITGSGTGH